MSTDTKKSMEQLIEGAPPEEGVPPAGRPRPAGGAPSSGGAPALQDDEDPQTHGSEPRGADAGSGPAAHGPFLLWPSHGGTRRPCPPAGPAQCSAQPFRVCYNARGRRLRSLGYSLPDGRFATLSFDDGFRDNYDYIAPILDEQGGMRTASSSRPISSDDDGFQCDSDGLLRNPHNGHLTMLARSGVPGLLLWILARGLELGRPASAVPT